MASLNLSAGQQVKIPEVLLSDGSGFLGTVRATDGQTVVIELSRDASGGLPARISVDGRMSWKDETGERHCPVSVRERVKNAVIVRVRVDERREAPRLRVDMQVEYRLVPENEVEQVTEEVMARINSLDEQSIESIQLLRTGEDPINNLREEIVMMREMLSDLMQKVDDLTTIVRGGKPATSNEMTQPLAIQNCSATGIGLVTAEEAAQGRSLRLRLTLRTSPPAVIDCMGELARHARAEGTQGRFDWGVRFTHIHESDRERLIHYLFKIQRRMLRDMKEARESITGTD